MDIASPNLPPFGRDRLSQGGALDSDNNKSTSEFKDSEVPPGGGFRGAVPDWNATGTTEPKEMILITQSLKEVQQVMSDYVGIVRNDIRLQRALRRLDLLWEETEQLYESSTLSPQLLELRNMITVGYLIVKGASFRKESRGLHYNTDYPGKSHLVQNIVL
jgi:L-aspartate oxidase